MSCRILRAYVDIASRSPCCSFKAHTRKKYLYSHDPRLINQPLRVRKSTVNFVKNLSTWNSQTKPNKTPPPPPPGGKPRPVNTVFECLERDCGILKTKAVGLCVNSGKGRRAQTLNVVKSCFMVQREET